MADVEHGIDGDCECCCHRHGKPLMQGEYGLLASNCEDCEPEERSFDDALGMVCDARERERQAGGLKR